MYVKFGHDFNPTLLFDRSSSPSCAYLALFQ